jgi:hypothetical protein
MIVLFANQRCLYMFAQTLPQVDGLSYIANSAIRQRIA